MSSLFRFNFNYDIALLRLTTAVEFTATVRPACLSLARALAPGDVATVSGFGRETFNSRTDQLRAVSRFNTLISVLKRARQNIDMDRREICKDLYF